MLVPDAASLARRAGLVLVTNRDLDREHGELQRGGGQPRKLGVHVRRRTGRFEDDRKRRDEGGWTEGGGGGGRGGGGRHAVLDEKKMVGGRPSPRRGRLRRRDDGA